MYLFEITTIEHTERRHCQRSQSLKMINFNLRLFFVFALFSKIQADIIFTSPLKTKALFISVDNLIATLEEYVNVEETRLETLKK